jgi:hypothetical protein
MMRVAVIFVLLLTASSPADAGERSLPETVAELTPPSGILYDRVLPLSDLELHDGSGSALPATWQQWRQMYSEIMRASIEKPAWPAPADLEERWRTETRSGTVPVVFLDARYDRIRRDAVSTGALVVGRDGVRPGAGDPLESRRVFAASALRGHTHRGARVRFVLDRSLYFSNIHRAGTAFEIDFDDGRGFRSFRSGDRPVVQYGTSGAKTIRVRMHTGAETLSARFTFDVLSLTAPLPHDTLMVTGTIPYLSGTASGEAYVYLAPGRSTIVNPVIVIEGFDLDDSMNWDELYELINAENMLEDLRADGFDAIVLNFTQATDYIQRNAFVLVELIQQIEAQIAPQMTTAVIGASMGGLVGRFALAYMETNAIPHRTRTFIAFDSPEMGANIPLGMQYWLNFFADQSEDAAFLLSRLDTPAARQMLVYHYEEPPASTPGPDALYGDLVNDLALVGNYPTQPRKVAVINGSSTQAGQGFAAGEQIIQYEYDDFFTDITGNVWAVPDGSSQMIFDGAIVIFGITQSAQQVSVSGTAPYDNAPGGSRASMAQMDSAQVSQGDIIALHDSHAFIPAVSALGLPDTTDLFYDIAGDPMIASLSPFDVVYFPVDNQAHVEVTPENKAWFIAEVSEGATGVKDPAVPGAHALLHQNVPNPFNPSTVIRFRLAAPGRAVLAIYNAAGARVATLVDAELPAGERGITWDGRNDRGIPVGSGVYFCKLTTAGGSVARKITLIK